MNHDAIVIGAGHNGLTCAAYLARGGMRPLVLEARPELGGCAATVDALGARVNICNCDHVMVRSTPIIEELSLETLGLRYLDVEPGQLSLSWDGEPPWFLFHDVERTLDGLRLAHPGEVDGYRRYLKAALPVARLVIALTQEPLSPAHAARALTARRARGVASLLRWSRRSAAEVLRSFFRTEALIAPALVTGPVVWGVAPTTPGTGLGALGYAFRHVVTVGRPAGGSGALVGALAGAVRRHGGSIRPGAAVEAILADRRRVHGVRLADGEELRADRVVVACDPTQALVAWLRDPPSEVRSMLARWTREPRHEGYESKIDAVIGRAPAYRAVDETLCRRLGVADAGIPTAVVAGSTRELERGHRTMSARQVPARPPLLVNVPSVLDPSLRVDETADHVLSLEALQTPYGFGGGWESRAEPERWLQAYARLVAPPFLGELRRWRVMTPADYERDLRLPRGHAASFPKSPLAALVTRDRALTRYETPLRGLFLTGAATFPGAGIWGAPGRNAAQVILARSA